MALRPLPTLVNGDVNPADIDIDTLVDGATKVLMTKTERTKLGAIGRLTVNVTAAPYNAVGDGTADDTAAITAAINAVNTAGGGTVFFPRGTYLTGPQIIYSNMIFAGEGPTASTLKLKPGSNADLVATKDFAILTGTNGIGSNIGCRGHGLQDLCLDADRQNQGAQSRCYATFGWNHTVNNVWFINGHTIGVTSEWLSSDSTGDHMEALWANFKVWRYGGVKGGSIGLDWNGPHDSILSNYIVATLDSTIRPYHAKYGATPIDAGSGATATFPGSGTFTFTTTEAAPTDLFPETGGWFVVPHDIGNGPFSVIAYTAASTSGTVTTFTGCTGAASRVVGTQAANVGIIKPSWGVMVNRLGKKEFGLVHSQAHIWGRNHIGLGCKMLTSPYYDVPIFSSGCHVEGAFLVNVLMSSKSQFINGAIYGTFGQGGNEYEVGILLSLPWRGAESVQVKTLIYNVGATSGPATGAPVVNVNSDFFDLEVIGTTNTTSMFLTSATYLQKSRSRIICQNDVTKSSENFAKSYPPVFNGGLTVSGGSGTAPKIIGGTGVPSTSTISGATGDLYVRKDGAVGSLIYQASTVSSGIVTAWTVVL